MISASLIKIGPPRMIDACPIKTRKRQEEVKNDKCKLYHDWTARNDWCKPNKDQEETERGQER